MLLREFYNTVILSEEQCVEFLRENQLLVQAADHPPCSRCGHVMEQKRKRDRGGEFRLVPRCPQRGCQTTRSVRQGELCGIVELVYMFTKMRGVPATTFQSHLDYFCWCAAQEGDIFLEFLRDIRAVYA